MDTNTENTNVQQTEIKPSKVNTVKETNFLYLSYYILSFAVLFFRTFSFKTDAITVTTGIIGFEQYWGGIGFFYYIANAIGLLSVFLKPLHFMEKLGAKVISLVNVIVTLVLILMSVPNSIQRGASITVGFWIILAFHVVAVLVFWYQFIKAHRNKNKD